MPNYAATLPRAPRIPPAILRRPRLIATCGADPARLTLVSAPAGFGKSCAVADWLRAYAIPHVWVALEDGDDDPVRLVAHLADALADALPECAAVLARLSPGAPIPAAAFAPLAARTEPLVLVLDDVHLLESDGSLGVVRQLLERAPPALRLALLTRVDPPLPLARLRLEGELRELREGELRVTADEGGAFFAHARTDGLDPALVALLLERTEGWIAGLRLAAIALEGSRDPEAAVHAFVGTHRFVVEYLVEEALGRRRPELQRFLMESAVLPRFTAEACEAVTGIADAAALLAEAERGQLFLVPLDAERRWYRYHHLFGELLVWRLQQSAPARAAELRARGSEWFAARGDVHEALRLAAALPDDEALVRLLDAHADAILARSELATLERWVARLREPTARREPLFLAALAWLRLLTARAPELPSLMAALERAIDDPPPGYPPERREEARVLLALLRAQLHRYTGDVEQAIVEAEALLATLPAEQARPRALALHNLACARQQLGEPRRALALFEAAYDESQRAGLTYVALSSLANGGAMRVQLTGVAAGLEALELAVRMASDRHLDGIPAFGILLQHRAHALIAADRLDEAEASLGSAMALAAAGHEAGVHANARVLLARVLALRGKVDDADALLTQVAVDARAERSGLVETSLEVERARLALAAGDPARALTILDADATSPNGAPDATPRPWTIDREGAALVRLIALVRLGDRERAREVALTLADFAESREHGVALSYARAALALLSDERTERVALVEALLRRIEQRGDVRAVLDFGDPMRALLQVVAPQLPEGGIRRLARMLLARLDESPSRSAARIAPPAGLREPLTDRELEVMHHLSRGLANKAIAGTLHVSTDTVKSHLKHAFAKLRVRGRREAAERFVALGFDRGSNG
jgi:LuxR family maltose regulon positive regulatory protein